METLGNIGGVLASTPRPQKKNLSNVSIAKIENGYLVSFEAFHPEEGYGSKRFFAATVEELTAKIIETFAKYEE